MPMQADHYRESRGDGRL